MSDLNFLKDTITFTNGLPNGLRYLRVGGRGLCLGAEKTQSQIPLQIRPVYFESLPRFKCRIWGHRTRSVASGRVSEGRGQCTLCWAALLFFTTNEMKILFFFFFFVRYFFLWTFD